MSNSKLIVKPTINFLSTDTDVNLSADVGRILEAMTDNSVYPDPAPSLAAILAALDGFSKAITDAAGGGVLFTAIKNARRAELVALVRPLASYVAVACGGDYTKLLSSGFPTHKPRREAVGMLAEPPIPNLSHGIRSGELKAKTKSQRGAFIYNWRVALASSPDVILQTVQSTGARTIFSGLTPGQRYGVQVNVVGAAGPSDWSIAALLIAI